LFKDFKPAQAGFCVSEPWFSFWQASVYQETPQIPQIGAFILPQIDRAAELRPDFPLASSGNKSRCIEPIRAHGCQRLNV
jgi:hypothetical protein